MLCGVLTYLFSPDVLDGRETTRLLLAWNVGALLYLGLAGAMMARATHSSMRRRAIQEDEGKFVVLGGVIVATVACLAAIVLDLQSTGEPVRLTLESRHNQDADDHPIIWAARRPTPPLTYEHVSGAGEPLLWLADAYAWLVGAGGDWQRRLGNSVRVIDVG